MLYLSHAHKPSTILQSLVLPDFFPSGPCLAHVHHTSIAFLSLPASQPSSASPSSSPSSAPSAAAPLQEIATVDINARIIAVKALASAAGAHGKRHESQRLLVLTDHFNPRILVLTHNGASDNHAAIATESTLLLDQIARAPAEIGLGLTVEPVASAGPSHFLGQRIAASHTHSGLLRILPILSDAVDRQKSPSALSRRRPSRAGPQLDVVMDDVAGPVSPASASGRPDPSQAFGVRLPHPTLLSSAFLHPTDPSASPALALLSLSSVPSRIPGLGQQCLPVLSFHYVDSTTQELHPIAWGPPRRAPSSVTDPARSDADAGPSSTSNPSSQTIPGSFDENDDDSKRKKQKKQDARKKHGPSAMGDRMDQEALQKREETWAKAPLTRAHVPLPYADALGAHLIHTIPASAGGGVIVFSETSILYVPPPALHDNKAHDSTVPSAEAGPSSQGKRRKASSGADSAQQPSYTADSGSVAAMDVIQSPSVSGSRSNENGKRRRSSAALLSSPPTSPSSSRNEAERRQTRLLRTSLPFPVQVIAATTVNESASTQASSFLHVLFACSSGSLSVLKISLKRSDQQGSAWPVSLSVEHLGDTSQAAGPNALTYMGESFIHVSSTTGDAVLYRIEPVDGHGASQQVDGDSQLVTPPSSPPPSMPLLSTERSTFSDSESLPAGGRLEEVHRWSNLGPIVDFVVDDGSGGDPASGSSAQARIVTCSGSGPTGSLRIVRNGASTEQLAELDLPEVSRTWSIHSGSGEARTTTMLVLAYLSRSAFISFLADGYLADLSEPMTAAGIRSDLPAIAVSTIESRSDTVFGIVNRSQALVVSMDGDGPRVLASFSPAMPDQAIVAGAVNEHGQFVLGLADRSLVQLAFDGSSQLSELTRIVTENEVSCLDISPLKANEPASYCAAGFWGSKSAQIYSIPGLEPVAQSSFAETSFSMLPRAIVLHQFGLVDQSSVASGQSPKSTRQFPHLLIGLGDGTLVSYGLSLPTAESFTKTVGIFEPKSVSLGSRALRLEKVQTSLGLAAISVAGDRPTIVYADSKRITYSSLAFKGVSSVTTLHAAGQPPLNAFATPTSIKVASTGVLEKVDVRTVPLGYDQPLGIAQDPQSRVFGVVTWAFLPHGTATKGVDARGAIRLLDQAELSTLDEARLEPGERPNCIAALSLAGKRYLVVGTGFIRPDSDETTSGRLLGFEVQSGTARHSKEERELKLAFEHEVRGNVFGVVGIEGRLAAAVNSEVQVYEVADSSVRAKASLVSRSAGVVLKQKGHWGSAFLACTLSVAETNRLVVGDALRSMNILEVHPNTGKITEIARDCDPFWTTAADMIDASSQTLVGADIAFNLYTSQRVKLSEEAKRKIKRAKEQEMERGRTVGPSSNAFGGDQGGYAHVMQRQAVYHYGDMINKFKKGKHSVR